MDSKCAFSLIDSYDLNNFRTLLYLCAPDLCIQLDLMIQRGADAHDVLSSARAFVKQAYLREDN